MNEASGAAGGGNGVKLVVGGLAIAGLAAGIYFTVGQPGTTETGARPEAAAEAWRARWTAAKLTAGRDVPPDGPDTAFAALQLPSLDAVRAKLDGLREAGALVLADPRARRRHEVLTAGALLTASEAKTPPTVHPIEAAWLMLALARRADASCGIVEVQGAVPTPLMLTRQRYAVRCGETTLTLDGKPLVRASRPVDMAEAAATFLVVRGHVARARVFDAAQADLAAADVLVPGLPAARFARGVLQIEQGVTEMGEIACTGAVEAADDPMARLFLADVYTATAKPFKAFEMVDAVAKRWPKLAEGHVAQGMLVAGRVETAPDAQKEALIAEARAAFSRALELDPAVGGAEAGLAQLDLIAGDREAAIAKLRAAVTRSKDLDAAALLAQLLLDDQDAQGAVAALREVDRRDEERWWMLLVQALASTGDGDGALREAEAASAAFPASKQLVVLRAQLLRQLERVEEAANLMRPLAQDPGPGPEGASFAAMAAELLLQVGDLDGAIAGLRTSLARDPAQKEAAMLLIAALGRAGKVPERDLEIAKLIGSGTSHEEIASLMLEVGDAPTAESVLEAGVQATKLDEAAGQRLVTLLAMLYVASGRKPEALTLKTTVVAKVGGAETAAGAALIKAVDDAIAGAEAELEKMAREGEALPAAEPTLSVAAAVARAQQVATAAGLGSDAIARLERLPALFDDVQRFGARWNLVGDASARGVVDEHIVESLALAGLVAKQGIPASVVDVGAGAGLELLLWLLLWPDVRGTAVEPRRKRADFIELAAGRLGVLGRLTVVRGRLGEPGCPPLTTPFALATSRATFAPERWLVFGAELVGPDGRLTAHLPAGVEPPIPDGWAAAGRAGVPGRGDHEVVVYVRKEPGR